MANHLPHLEDLLILNGTQAVAAAVSAYSDVTIKYDGAPAVIIGADQRGAFVSTKAFFNKVPKLYRTLDQLDDIEDVALRAKMSTLLSYVLYQPPQPGVISQGDLLWGAEDINRHFGTDKTASMTVQPNLLHYTIARPQFDIGVAMHTAICGPLWEGSCYVGSPPVHVPANLPRRLEGMLDERFDAAIEAWPKGLTVQFTNWCIRHGWPVSFTNSTIFTFLAEQCARKVDGVKKQETKDAHRAAFETIAKTIQGSDRQLIDDTWKTLVEWKLGVITVLDAAADHHHPDIKAELHTDDGPVAGHEGFVVSGPTDFKLVRRHLFSHHNLQADARRGWTKYQPATTVQHGPSDAQSV